MTGSPAKRQRIVELMHERDELAAEVERLKKKLPPKEPREKVGRPFDAETAKDASAKGVAARERNRKRDGLTEQDVKDALAALRRNVKSKDEKIAHNASVKILEYELGRPDKKTDTPERVVFASAYLDPSLATADADEAA